MCLSANYTFVHVPKTGGTSVEQLFARYNQKYITGGGHEHTCADVPNPIIIIRHPLERFYSAFSYWKYGGGNYKRDPKWIQKYQNVTTHDFLSMLKDWRNHQKDLFVGFTSPAHFFEQSLYIPPKTYSKTVVIIYSEAELGDKVDKLLNYFQIPKSKDKNAVMRHEVRSHNGLHALTTGSSKSGDNSNQSTNSRNSVPVVDKHEQMLLTADELDILEHDVYRHDFKLYQDLLHHPELFRKVF